MHRWDNRLCEARSAWRGTEGIRQRDTCRTYHEWYKRHKEDSACRHYI